MNCDEARRHLEFCTLGHERIAEQTLPVLNRHLAECKSCQAAFESQRHFDHEVARVMSEVAAPSGMTERLKNAVAAEGQQPSSSGAAPANRTVSRRALLGVTALAAAMACGWLAIRVPPLTEADLHYLAELDIEALPNASSETPYPIPSGWNRVRGLQFAEHARLATIGTRTTALLPLTVQFRSRAPQSPGFLIRLPGFRPQRPVDATSFSSATVQYASFGSWVAWREGQAVYVCVLRDNHAMEGLRKAIADGRGLT